MPHGHPRFTFLSDVKFSWARGAISERKPQERGESAPSSLILSPPLRFPLRLSFLIPLLSGAHRLPLAVWRLSVLRIVSLLAVNGGISRNIYSLFVIHHSLFTKNIGSSNAAEAALAACAWLIGGAPLTAPGGKRLSALPTLTNGGKYDKMFDGMQTKGGSAVRTGTSAAEASL